MSHASDARSRSDADDPDASVAETDALRQARLAEADAWMAGGALREDSPLMAELRAVAERARANAHAPYSKYRVGAALVADDGRVYAGCNVENASFGATICAERIAVGRMVTDGVRRVRVCLVIGSGETAVPPCGPCRQVLHELGTGAMVISVGPEGVLARWSLAELFPHPMGGHDLPKR